MHRTLLACAAGGVALGMVALRVPGATSAQIPSPPSTFFGSVTDAAGPVAAGVRVEAYIGDKLCGTRETEFTGDGDARVTVYSVHVVSSSQTAGCGTDGAVVRVKVGDRFAEQTGRWRAGPVQLDVTFGGATPAVIPTQTPTPTRPANATATPVPPTPTPRPPTAASGSPVSAPSPGETATAGPSATSPAGGSPTPTLAGGITSSTPAPLPELAGDDSSGFPVWGVIAVILGFVAVIGGGIGYAMSRQQRDIDDEAGADL
jgi:hypothetical protein